MKTNLLEYIQKEQEQIKQKNWYQKLSKEDQDVVLQNVHTIYYHAYHDTKDMIISSIETHL